MVDVFIADIKFQTKKVGIIAPWALGRAKNLCSVQWSFQGTGDNGKTCAVLGKVSIKWQW